MKKLFIVIAFVLSVSIVTFSQDLAKKGTWELGGSVGFTSYTYVYSGTTDPDGAHTSFSISPEAGYFITDNFELGLLPFSFTSTSFNGSSESQFNFLLAPTWNFDMQSNLYPYIQALIGYGSETYSGNSYSGLDYGAQAGIKLEIAKSALINIGLQYLLVTRELSGASDRSGYNNFQIMAGFSVFIK